MAAIQERTMLLLKRAEEMVANSISPDVEGFDLANWRRHPQPALGRRRPSELIRTDHEFEAVVRVMASIERGAYQ